LGSDGGLGGLRRIWLGLVSDMLAVCSCVCCVYCARRRRPRPHQEARALAGPPAEVSVLPPSPTPTHPYSRSLAFLAPPYHQAWALRRSWAPPSAWPAPCAVWAARRSRSSPPQPQVRKSRAHLFTPTQSRPCHHSTRRHSKSVCAYPPMHVSLLPTHETTLCVHTH
jgi:hypothetical protein